MKKLWVLLPVLVLSICILVPDTASAQIFDPLIEEACHCPGSAPDWGCVFQTVQNAMNLAISLGVVIATLVIAYAGALWVLSPVNPANREKGRTMILNAVIGLAIVLVAWIFVDALMKSVYNDKSGFGPWEKIIEGGGEETYCLQKNTQESRDGAGGGQVGTTPNTQPSGDVDGDGVTNAEDADDDNDGKPDAEDNCPAVANPQQQDADSDGTGDACEETVDEEPDTGSGSTMTHSCTGTTGSGVHSGVDKQSLSCSNCTPLSRSGFSCTDSVCALQASVASKVNSISFSGSAIITEAFPPSYCSHRNSCHYDGTCIDVDIGDQSDYISKGKAYIDAARAVGLNPVLEVRTTAECEAIRDQGNVPEIYLHRLSSITGTHFSVYGNNVGAQPGC